MKVYIVRHGKAERESSSLKDEDRILTARGVEQARFIGAQLHKSPVRPSLIISSPVTRAIETARLVHAAVNCRFETSDALRVDQPVSLAVDLLTRYAFPPKGPAVDCIVLVGHNPQVSELFEVLVNGMGAARCLFRTGEAILLELNRSTLIGSGRVLAQIRLNEECGVDHA